LQLAATELHSLRVTVLYDILLNDGLNMHVNLFRHFCDQKRHTRFDCHFQVPLKVRITSRGSELTYLFPLLLQPFRRLLLWVNAKNVLFGLLHHDCVVDTHTILGKPIVLPVSNCKCVSEKLLKDKIIVVGDVLVVQ
jgi:hypothetical protein